MLFQLHIEGLKGEKDKNKGPTAWVKLIFRPSLVERLTGKKDVIIKSQLDRSVLKYDAPPPPPPVKRGGNNKK